VHKLAHILVNGSVLVQDNTMNRRW